MRTPVISKLVVATALAGLFLTGCGTKDGSAGSAGSTPQPPSSSDDGGAGKPGFPGPEPGPDDRVAYDESAMRVFEVNTDFMAACFPGGKARLEELMRAAEASGEEAELPDEFWEGVYGPGGPPIPVGPDGKPIAFDAPAPPTPIPTQTGPVPEVPLIKIESCVAGEHAKRITQGFGTRRPATYEAMRGTLTGLDYPADRIIRMPDHAGGPRVRVDLRFMTENLVIEVTAAGNGVAVEGFGAPAEGDVHLDVAQVVRKPA
ncbi:hypothetical protein [Yinghuangia soli]|uniref:Lipoprotein n=1 Tax=Yinghuangia soli TaxID=2908204 RepID=A0AA41TYI0_9ACTN|nr:hypothetical protein [Yinghuangia soli]MCF2526200.1 hypothetical protein [Yinghuangia soli]